MVLLALCAPSWALTVTVGGPNADYSTLAAAAADAAPLGITEIDLGGDSWGGDGSPVALGPLTQALRIEGFGVSTELPPLTVSQADVTVADSSLATGASVGLTASDADLTLEAVSADDLDLAVSITGGTLAVAGGAFTGSDRAILATDCDVSIDGGAIFADNGAADVAGWSGGAVSVSGGTLYVGAATFTGNVAADHGGFGGAIFATGAASVSLVGATFADNVAEFGGAVRVEAAPLASVVVDSSEFDGNLAGADIGVGGALYVSDVATMQLDWTRFDGGGALVASNGGAAFLERIGTFSGQGDTFAHLGVDQNGGAIDASLCPSFSLTDPIGDDTWLGENGKGGFLHNQGSNVTVTGGVFTEIWGCSGGVFEAESLDDIAPVLSVTGVDAEAPESEGGGGFIRAEPGTVLDVSWCVVTGASASGGSFVSAERAQSVSLTDNLANDGTTEGLGAAVSIVGSSDVFVQRNTLCGNENLGDGPSALEVSGGVVTNNRIFSNVGLAVEVLGGGDETRFEHNTLADNTGTNLQIATGGAAAVDWNLFAPGVGGAAVLVDDGAAGTLGANNFVEVGADPGNGLYGYASGAPLFQEGRPFSCDDLLLVAWSDALLVDLAPADGVDADVDGSKPDIGAWGGPDAYAPGAVFDGDGDGVRVDLDCDDADPKVFPGAADPIDGIDENCDGVAESVDSPGETPDNPDCTDCGAAPAQAEGASGCSTAGGVPGSSAGILVLAGVALRRRSSRKSRVG